MCVYYKIYSMFATDPNKYDNIVPEVCSYIYSRCGYLCGVNAGYSYEPLHVPPR